MSLLTPSAGFDKLFDAKQQGYLEQGGTQFPIQVMTTILTGRAQLEAPKTLAPERASNPTNNIERSTHSTATRLAGHPSIVDLFYL